MSGAVQINALSVLRHTATALDVLADAAPPEQAEELRARAAAVRYAREQFKAAIDALRLAEDRLAVVIECDSEDRGGAAEDDLAAWEAVRAVLYSTQGGAA